MKWVHIVFDSYRKHCYDNMWKITLLKANSCYIRRMRMGRTAPEITWISVCTLASDSKGSFPKSSDKLQNIPQRLIPPAPRLSSPPHGKHTPTHTSETLNSLKEVLFWRVSLGVAVVVCVCVCALALMTEQHKAGLLSALQSVFNPGR